MWPARQLRTSSPLEREFRNCRRRFAGAVLLHSAPGLATGLTSGMFVVQPVALACSHVAVTVPLSMLWPMQPAFPEGRIHY